ncbi:MAG: hypothetical protein N2517_01845 [Ignavibacteria bacterium]|nr:hypothetical protein [Ignavibacteria bacterium]
MQKKKILEELVELLKSLGFKIRKDSGNFEGGACILFSEKLIVLNKNMPTEIHFKVLANVARDYLNKIYIKPRLREIIEKELETNSLQPIEIYVSKNEENNESNT